MLVVQLLTNYHCLFIFILYKPYCMLYRNNTLQVTQLHAHNLQVWPLPTCAFLCFPQNKKATISSGIYLIVSAFLFQSCSCTLFFYISFEPLLGWLWMMMIYESQIAILKFVDTNGRIGARTFQEHLEHLISGWLEDLHILHPAYCINNPSAGRVLFVVSINFISPIVVCQRNPK